MLSFFLMFSTNCIKNAKPPRWWARFGPWATDCRTLGWFMTVYLHGQQWDSEKTCSQRQSLDLRRVNSGLPWCPGAKILYSQSRGPGFDPWSGN